MTLQLRVANPEDFPAVWEFFLTAHRNDAIFSLDEGKCREVVQQVLRRETGFVVGIWDEDKLAASAAVVVTQPWYSGEWFLSERWINVLPAYRQTDCFPRLAQFLKTIADDWKLVLQLGISTLDRAEVKTRLYSRHFTFLGGYYSYGEAYATGPTAESIGENHGR